MPPPPFVMRSWATSNVGLALSRFGPGPRCADAGVGHRVAGAAAVGRARANAPGWVDASPTAGALEPYQVSASSTIGTEAPMARAIGRFEMRRSGRRSRNGQAISRIIHSVGMIIVAKRSSSGVLKMRSSSKRKKKYHSGRGSYSSTPGSAWDS